MCSRDFRKPWRVVSGKMGFRSVILSPYRPWPVSQGGSYSSHRWRDSSTNHTVCTLHDIFLDVLGSLGAVRVDALGRPDRGAILFSSQVKSKTISSNQFQANTRTHVHSCIMLRTTARMASVGRRGLASVSHARTCSKSDLFLGLVGCAAVLQAPQNLLHSSSYHRVLNVESCSV